MAEKLDISPAATLVGGIVYDDSARLMWGFNDAIDTPSTVYRIEQLKRTRQGNNLRKAFEVARDKLFLLENGDRRNMQNVLVAFVDKTPEDDALTTVAKELKDAGVQIILVAVGYDVAAIAIKDVASDDDSLIETPDLSTTANETLKSALIQSRPGT